MHPSNLQRGPDRNEDYEEEEEEDEDEGQLDDEHADEINDDEDEVEGLSENEVLGDDETYDSDTPQIVDPIKEKRLVLVRLQRRKIANPLTHIVLKEESNFVFDAHDALVCVKKKT